MEVDGQELWKKIKKVIVDENGMSITVFDFSHLMPLIEYEVGLNTEEIIDDEEEPDNS